jgi:hypothetical protein
MRRSNELAYSPLPYRQTSAPAVRIPAERGVFQIRNEALIASRHPSSQERRVMNTDTARDLQRVWLGLAKIAAAAALAFFPVYTMGQPITTRSLVIDLVLISVASVLLALGFEQIFDEFDKPES